MINSKKIGRGVVAGLILALSASLGPATTHVQAAHTAAVTGKVGFLFSDFTTSARWQFDKLYFIQALKKLDPGVTVVVTDAKASQTTQQNEAKSDLTAGVKVLIDVPVDWHKRRPSCAPLTPIVPEYRLSRTTA